MKKPHLVVYDYGMGGVWALVNAHSSAEITERYPILLVVETRPAWMKKDDYRRIEATRSFDIDDPTPQWLVAAVSER